MCWGAQALGSCAWLSGIAQAPVCRAYQAEMPWGEQGKSGGPHALLGRVQQEEAFVP